jgi:hypothetical protein
MTKESWIHPPKNISIYVSKDGNKYRLLETADSNLILQSKGEVENDIQKNFSSLRESSCRDMQE